jgi:hypothetical protein
LKKALLPITAFNKALLLAAVTQLLLQPKTQLFKVQDIFINAGQTIYVFNYMKNVLTKIK